jgi:hypothetical protein
MATIDEFALRNIGLWWKYGISRHCDEWKYIIIGRIFERKIVLIPPSLKISESSSNGSYRNTDEVWWRYGICRSCDECSPRWRIMFGSGYENCPEFGDVEVGHRFPKDPSKKLKCNVHVFVILIVCDLFEWIRICAGFFIVCYYMHCRWRSRSSYQEGSVWGPFNRSNLAHFVHVPGFQARFCEK